MNRVILATVIIGLAVMLSMSSIEPSFAKQLDCKFGKNSSIDLQCKGGQPEVGDTVVLIYSSNITCEGTVDSVQDFDGAHDRKGFMQMSFIPPCGSIAVIEGTVQISGKL